MMGAVSPARALAQPNDEALVSAALASSREAFDELYRRHVQRALTVASRLLSNQADAEDAVQDSFALAFETIGSLRTPAAFGGWLVGIVVNRVRRILRRRGLLRRLGMGTSTIEIDAVMNPNAPADIRLELEQLLVKMEKWPVDEALAWKLRQLSGMSIEEIGQVTGWSRATVNRRLEAARERIAKLEARHA